MPSLQYDSRYSFITGVIRALEVGRLTREVIDQVLEMETAGDALNYIRKTLYASFQGRPEPGESPDSFLHTVREGVYVFVERYTFHGGIPLLFRLGYDYHNIKALLKGKIFEVPVRDSIHGSGTVEAGEMEAIFRDEEYDRLPDPMGHAVEMSVEEYYTTRSPLVLDVTVDRFLHSDLLDRVCALSSPFIEGYVRSCIDLLNFRIFSRAGDYLRETGMRKRLFISGGFIHSRLFEELADASPDESPLLADRHGYGRIARVMAEEGKYRYGLERECESTLIEYLGQARFLIWGMEALFGYAAMLERELSILGIIMSGKESGVPREEIKRRLPGIF